MTEEKKKNIRPAKNRFLRELFRESTLGEHTVLYGQHRVSVEGCRRILQYAPSKIRLRLQKRDLIIVGEQLRCVSFSGNRTTVCGEIVSLTFDAWKEKK